NLTVPFMYLLPVFLMEWCRPWMEKKFIELAFSSHVPPELLTVELETNKTNPMYVIKSLVLGMKQVPTIDLKALNVPTLIISGEPDKVVPPAAQKKFYKNLPHHQFYIISACSHMALLECPQKVNQHIANFLQNEWQTS